MATTMAVQPPGGQVTYLLGDPGRQAHEDPGISTPGLPYPQLGVKGNDHDVSIKVVLRPQHQPDHVP